MNLEKLYQYLLFSKRKNQDLKIDNDLLPRFQYFLDCPNFYHQYDFNKILYKDYGNDNKMPRILFINLGFNDFIQSFFFRNEIVKLFSSEKYNLDVITVFPNENLKSELYYLYKTEELKCGREWRLPVDNNKWKKIIEELLKNNQYQAIIVNGFNYYFYTLIQQLNKIKFRGKIIVYDPHLLVGRNDFRDLEPDILNDFAKYNIIVIADASAASYKKVAPAIKFKKFIKYKHSLPASISSFYPLKNSFNNSVFIGGDTNRDYKNLIKLIKLQSEYNFVICTSEKLDYNLPNLKIYSRQPFHRFLELMNSCDCSLIYLKNDHKKSGNIVTVLSLMLSKFCLVNNFPHNRKYVKNNANGYLFNNLEQLSKILSQISANYSKNKFIQDNAFQQFLEEHNLGNLVAEIFSEINM